ncbi:hypothetical protein SLA2020_242310 [Shorea laevis]
MSSMLAENAKLDDLCITVLQMLSLMVHRIYIMFQDKMIDLKAQAEALIVFANNIDGLLTCALRPSNVFGPGNAQLVPLLVNFAKCGLAKFTIGTGENMSDFTFSENVAHAHICAAEALDCRVVSVAGKMFSSNQLVGLFHHKS